MQTMQQPMHVTVRLDIPAVVVVFAAPQMSTAAMMTAAATKSTLSSWKLMVSLTIETAISHYHSSDGAAYN